MRIYYEGIITRKYRINRIPMEFNDYTDWVSEGRINPIEWGDFILAYGGEYNNQPICTVDNHEIEELRK